MNTSLKAITISAISMLILFSFSAAKIYKPRASPPAKTALTNGNLSISVSYSRPYKNGRLLFGAAENGALVPYGEKWRTGANEATEISLSTDVRISGNVLKAGTYSVYTIPEKDNWNIAFNSRTGYWGRTLIGSPFKDKKDVFRIQAPVHIEQEVEEQFRIDLSRVDDNETQLSFKWGLTLVHLTLEH